MTPSSPTAEERRHAACMAMARAPGLIRFASRYTSSLHDAEDAYQRSMEIALTSAPVTEPRRFMAWLHAVLRNEALALARARRREAPGAEADLADAVAGGVEDGLPLHALAEWRERYRSIQDGLAGLTDAQRICLILQSAGASYERIRQITGYSLRKVERSVLEGRASLRSWEVRLQTGEVCERLHPAIDRVALGHASAGERRSVARHVRHCGPCRALLRDRRESNEWLGALAPVALFAGESFLRTPDPTPAIAWWERIATGATVRAGTAIQMAMELPGAALAKVGAGTAAVVIAGAAGIPLVTDAVHPAPTAPAAAVRAASAPMRVLAAPAVGRGNGGAEVTALLRAARRQAAATHAAQVRRAQAVRIAPRPDPPPAAVAPAAPAAPTAPPAPAAPSSPAPAPAPAPSPGTLALEFGP